MISSRCSVTALACVLSFASAARAQTRPYTTLPAATGDATYSLVYTGRLFGYFRFPSEQTDKYQSCGEIKEDELLDAALTFQKEIDKLPVAGSLQIRAAVGDNFAPHVLAREMHVTLDNNANRTPEFIGKDLIVQDDQTGKWWPIAKPLRTLEERLLNGTATLTFDNVACFLRRMRFDAVVPGKHDFYYGAERLRALAGLLASASNDSRFTPVQMLGSNLSRVTKDRDRTPLPDEDVEHSGYDTEPPKEVKDMKGVKPVLPKVALPWLRSIRIANAIRIENVTRDGIKIKDVDIDALLDQATFVPEQLQQISTLAPGTCLTLEDTERRQYTIHLSVGAAEICAAKTPESGKPRNPAAIDLATCVTLAPGIPEREHKLSLTWPYTMSGTTLLSSDSNQAVCLYSSPDKKGKPFCTPFSVHAPFFEKPYVVKTGGGQSVAVFGVVDPSMREYVGGLNDTWLKKTANPKGDAKLEKSKQTELQVSDPVGALTQVLQYCATEVSCAGARHVLLAQMPRAKAAQAAARFRPGTFDLVVAQSDSERASGDQTLTNTISFKPDTVNEIPEANLLVPGPHFVPEFPDAIRVRLQNATIRVTGNADGAQVIIKNRAIAADRIPVAQLPSAASVSKDDKRLFDWFKQSRWANRFENLNTMTNRHDKVEVLEQLALLTMREQCNADVALMQHRDVFLSPKLESAPLNETMLRVALDAVFWKGDFVSCRSVTGATLKALLDRSDEIEAAEANSVFGELEFSRNLAKLGVSKHHDDYIVSGQFLDPKKLYAIATTDYLAEGDTGYAILQTADPKPPPIPTLGKLDRISALIYADVSKLGTKQRDTRIEAHDYLDAADRRPLDETKLSRLGSVRNWFKEAAIPNAGDGSSKAETRFQQRPVWSVALETADLAFKKYEHRHGEKELSTFFGGTGISSLVAHESLTVNSNLQLRVKRSLSKIDAYSLSEMHIDHEKTTKDDEGRVISEPVNQIAQELGTLFNLWPLKRRNPSGYQLLTGVRFESQLREPALTIKLADPHKENLAQPLPKDVLGLLKIGIRHEFKDSAFEGGWLGGWKKSPGLFVIKGKVAGVMSDPRECTPGASFLIADCVSPDSDEAKQAFGDKFDEITSFERLKTRWRPRVGMFVNTRIHVPLGFGDFKFHTEENFEWYRKGDDDFSNDTRYRLRWKNAIEVPVIGNLKLAPAVELFLYQNKDVPNVGVHTFRSTTINIDVKYSFDRRSGLSWRKALVYANPTEEK